MVTFTRTFSPDNSDPASARSLYVIFDADAPPAPYHIAFSIPTVTAMGLPLDLSLAESWAVAQGVYLFLKDFSVDAESQSVLGQRVSEFLLTPAVRQTRFLWIENPTASVFQWDFYRLGIVLDSSGPSSGREVVEQLSFFALRNYGLAIARHVTCQIKADGSGFVFSPNANIHNLPGERSPSKRDPFYVSTSHGAQKLAGIVPNEQSEFLTLSLSGAIAGCFSFSLKLTNPLGNKPFAELAQLDIALRMFFKSANPVLDEDDPFSGFADLNSDLGFLISNHRYPFLGEDGEASVHYSRQADGSQDVTLYASLDPVSPLDAGRSYFAFVPPDQAARSSLSLPSCYRTNLGYAVHVTPHGYGEARLVFAEQPGQNVGAFSAPLYLVPQGKFTLSVPDYSASAIPSGTDFPIRAEDDFLCGLAGIEYIRLSSSHKNVLYLTPGKAAFTPEFVPDKIVETEAAEQQLDSTATTAWAAIEHIGAANFPIYFSQPGQSLLYRASEFPDGDGEASNDPMRFLEVPVTGLSPEVVMPLFPYGGVTGALQQYAQMETQLLNPQRRKQIRRIAQTDTTPLLVETAPAGPRLSAVTAPAPLHVGSPAPALLTSELAVMQPSIVATTSQGLLATYPTDFEQVNQLLLAKDTEDRPLSFQSLARTSPLRLAFQSSQLFLVVTDPQALVHAFLENQLTIQGWTFDLDPASWRENKGETDTVLIFKYLDKSLLETLRDLALWEQTETFVSGDVAKVRAVRDRLIQRFETAIATINNKDANAKDRESAAPLARIATSVSWSGMVGLNVAIAPNGLPDELKALKCGIKDEDNFYAQYVGSNGTPILPLNGTLAAEKSSLFGLLDYRDNSIPAANPSGYDFQVSSLRVQFQNSQITAFSSELNLTLDRLFDEATQLLNSQTGRNIVVIKGATERHDGVVTYAFTFSGANYFALPNSHIINNVDIIKATFTSDPPGSDPVLVVGRFTLWGRLNFLNIEAFDGFSFGAGKPLADEVLKASATLNSSATALSTDFQTGIDNLAKAKAQLAKALSDLDANEYALQFSKLTLTMNCQHADGQPTVTTFAMTADKIAFDLARSQPRPDSLYSKFPLKLVSFIDYSADQLDRKPRGYLPVKTPLSAKGKNALPDNGFGLNFELNLGSLGALAGAAQLIVNLAFIWQPNTDGQAKDAVTFVGLKMPGFGGDVLGFPLQSVLKLSFKQVEMLRDISQKKPAYLLKIKNVALKFFVLKFPPNGQTEIVVFGNPDATGSNDAIGWYAAYAKEPKALPEGQPGGRASPRRRK